MISPLCRAISGERTTAVVSGLAGSGCRYHRARQMGRQVELVEPGMCPLAFAGLYPSLFARHCNRARQGESTRYCPAGENGVLFRVWTEKKPFTLSGGSIDLARRFLNLLTPVEVHDRIIRFEAADKGTACPLALKPGDGFSFNISRAGEMCPSAFNSVYPLINDKARESLYSCPDHKVQVRFSGAAGGTPAPSPDCELRSGKVRVVSVRGAEKPGSWRMPFALQKWYTVDEVLQAAEIPCFTSFHIAFPYLLALSRGGAVRVLNAGPACGRDTLPWRP